MDDASTSGESELIVDGEVNQEREERDSDAASLGKKKKTRRLRRMKMAHA